jgi:hypothetical protein
MIETAKKFSEIRSKVLADSDGVVEPGLLLLPQEFLAIELGLIEFAKAVFENNPYQEQPSIAHDAREIE